MTGAEAGGVEERLKELFPSCESDCTDGCKYGCLSWLHRFDPPRRSRSGNAAASEDEMPADEKG